MLSIPQLTSVVKAAPMPLYVKEQILDQVLGYHDDLHEPSHPVRTARPHDNRVKPRAERVAEARQIGAFVYQRTERSGDVVYDYCKSGEPAYEVVVRGDQLISCTCKDFQINVARDPDYCCKHCDLYAQQDRADTLIAESARQAAAWETAWAHHKLGRITDDECNAAYARYQVAKDAMKKVVLPCR